MSNLHFRSHLQLHFIVFIWGFTAILGHLISLNAFSLVWYRMLLASLFIGFYLWYKGINVLIGPKKIGRILLTGGIIALHWFTFFMAIKVSNVSVTLACISTGALFASILGPLINKTAMIWYEVLLGFIVMIGLYVIFKVETQYGLGIALALVSAFLSALFAIINGKFVRSTEPAVVSFYEMCGGVLFTTVGLLFTGGFGDHFFHLSAMDSACLLLLGSVCTAYAFVASAAILRFLSPYTVMLTINLEPLYGILLAVLIFPENEQMSFAFYLGGCIIISTVLANALLKRHLNLCTSET